MGQLKWYKRDPEDALTGMMGLTLEERGAYNTVLDLIYLRDGNLPDDDRFVSGWLGVDVRVWRRIKGRLMNMGKLYLDEGFIRNKRADAEVDTALARVGSARDAGRASGRIRKHKSDRADIKNSDLARTDVPTDRERTFERIRERERDIEPSVLANSRSLFRQDCVGEDMPAKPKGQPIEAAFRDWEKAATEKGWSVPRLLTDQRRKKLGARLRTHGREGWRAALTKAWESPLLGGSEPPSWFNFDWITKNDENLLKVLEGNYDRTGNGFGGGPVAPTYTPTRNLSTDEREAARQRLIERGELQA